MLDQQLGRGTPAPPKGGMAAPPSPPAGAAPGAMGYLRRNEKSGGSPNTIGGAKNLEEWFQRVGAALILPLTLTLTLPLPLTLPLTVTVTLTLTVTVTPTLTPSLYPYP